MTTKGVGLALSGGGIRSYAEVAALKDMERNGIKVGAVAGTSMGSVIAALVAGGIDAASIQDLLSRADKRIVEEGVLSNMKFHIFDLMWSRGLVATETMHAQAEAILNEAGIHGFKDIRLPLAIPAVDLGTGQLTVFTNDPEYFDTPEANWKCETDHLSLCDCLTASSAYPLAITPAQYQGHAYIDGGCRMNLPTPLFNRDLVDGVVGVAMQRAMGPMESKTPLAIAQRTVSCGSAQLDILYAQQADIFINLPVSGDAFSAGRGEEFIDEAQKLLNINPVDWSAHKPVADTKANVDETSSESVVSKLRKIFHFA